MTRHPKEVGVLISEGKVLIVQVRREESGRAPGKVCFANSKFTEEGSEFMVESEWDPMNFVAQVLKREKRKHSRGHSVC